MEEWKNVKGYESLYQVSNLGMIKSLYRYGKKEENILKQNLRGKYLSVILFKEGKAKSEYVHRLVAETFIPHPDDRLQVNHINGDKTDNRVENLEWCTNSENQLHAYKNNLHRKKYGKENWNSKKILQYDLQGNYIKTWDCIRDIERELNIWNCNITNCCKGKRKTTGGYIWKYEKSECDR